MAKQAKQERNARQGSSGLGQPITRHPLFPAIVALWFAALFGLGSILPGTATIERIVAASGFARVIPMAAPPLGTTARLLIAMTLTGLGALAGLLVGLRLSARKAPGADAMRDLAVGDAGDADEAIAVAGRLPGRRRGIAAPIAFQEDAGPEPRAPAATDAGIFQLSDLEDDFDPEAFAASFEAGQRDGADDGASPANEPTREPAQFAEDGEEAGGGDAFSPAAWADPMPRPDHEEFEQHDKFEQEDGEAPAARLFESYARTVAPREAAVAIDGDSSTQAIEATASPQAPVASPGAERISAARLDDLSHVELLERLALAMEEQRRKLARANPLSVVAFAVENEAGRENAASSDMHAPAPQDVPQGEDDTETHALPASPAALILPRLSSLESTGPFAPPPFAPPPFGSRPSHAPGADHEPVQPLEDFESHQPAVAPAHIGGWPQGSIEGEDGASLIDDAVPGAVPIPAALRPVRTNAFDRDFDDAVPGYIPPRSIVMPVSVDRLDTLHEETSERPMAGLAGGHACTHGDDEAEGEEDGAPRAAPADGDAYAHDGDDMAEDDVLEEGYSSLLNLQRRAEPHRAFAAGEDEVGLAEFDEPELAGSAELPDAPSVPNPSAAAERPLPGARLFDPPPRSDPAETEKALRAALATLQRMSGAA